MSLFQRLDDWLIDECFQPWADIIQEGAGLSCFIVALVLNVVSYIAMFSGHYLIAVEPFLVGLRIASVGGLVCWSNVAIAMTFILVVKEKNHRRELLSGRLVANQIRIDPKYVFLRSLSLSLLFVMTLLALPGMIKEGNLGVFLMIFGLVIFFAAVYFMSCTPKPPSVFRKPKLAVVPQAI